MTSLKFSLSDFNNWADTTFPERPPEVALIHLTRELKEYRESGDVEELVDCWFIAQHFIHWVEKEVFTKQVDFEVEKAKKFEIVKQRKWSPPDAEGVIEHVRENG